MAYPMPNNTSQTPDRPASLGGDMAAGRKSSKKMPWLKGLITLIIVLLIIGGGIYLVANYTGIGGTLIGTGNITKSDWQAVFLSNGQVYFGKVNSIGKDFVILEDIYYLQVVSMQDTIAQPPDVQTQPEQRLTLIKLGNEIHGPTDEMIINRDHVVLIEDLKDTSKVVIAINDYLKSLQK